MIEKPTIEVPTRALTVIQPWGFCIERLGKTPENRTWPVPGHLIGHRIALHAGVKPVDTGAFQFIENIVGHKPEIRANLQSPVRGAVICTALLLGWVQYERGEVRGEWIPGRTDDVMEALQSRWFVGPIAHVYGDVMPITPVPCKGAQGYWTLPIEARHAIAERHGVTL